jgi:large-conductance mechanosensitive channel
MKKTLLNALIMSLLFMIFGLVISYIIMYMSNKESVKNFDHWLSVATSFFLTGLIVFLVNEYFGLNKTDCDKNHMFEIYI